MIRIPQTTTALGANGVFTGAEIKVSNDASATQLDVSFYADQASATNGAVIEGSNDGTTWYPLAQGSLVAATPLQLTAPLTYPYLRVVLTNGATAQGTLAIAAAIQ